MANIKSAMKRNRQNVKRHARNRHSKSTMRNAIKDLKSALEKAKKRTPELEKKLVSTTKIIQKVASKGMIHARTRSRLVSRLNQQVNRLG